MLILFESISAYNDHGNHSFMGFTQFPHFCFDFAIICRRFATRLSKKAA